jgi:cation:H+ antiporter
MVILNLILFLVFLAILIKCADYAIKYSSGLANILRFPEFVVSFFIIALVSVLPEATISIISAINGESELGLGTLLGSSVADLTLVLGIVSFFSRGGIEVKSRILKNNLFYLILLAFPLILGFDGRFSRIDGLILVLVGGLFFGKLLMKKNRVGRLNNTKKKSTVATILLLILSVAILLASAFLTVKYAVNFANDVKLPTILIGLTILAFGTCLPELIFSIKAVMKNHDELALGDILGTVIANVTIILGIVALISPFNHSFHDLYVTGTAMLFAGFLVTLFMKSKKTVNRFEGLLLILFYVLFLFAEFFVNKIFG